MDGSPAPAAPERAYALGHRGLDFSLVDVPELFRQHEASMSSQARKAGIVQHAGDRGGNREEVLRQFLAQHLPKKYGVTKGEVVTRAGGTATPPTS